MNWDPERIHANLSGVRPVQPAQQPRQPNPARGVPGEFQDLVQKAGQNRETGAPTADVTFSAHASQRLMQRGVMLDQQDVAKIGQAMDQAAEKGAKESLFLLRDIAMIVSIENRTVITALQGQGMKDNVFTQIDSAVLLDS